VHLKTLTLAGFKSFADRTRIECEPGVTVVVGPNGSGKSNLVDAIAWVMGTQATTALRTQRMEDVIFAGTTVRPALGRAEVSLTFDNGSGHLSLDVAEVTLTRRLFRDGTSEYEINGTPCRLLDIQELLGDSGVGRHQHVIVGQGRIDDVLSAGPDDHRAVIEEAAGVIKHRRRRERSVRRLEATDLDLERARDLLTEEERRLRPLKRQASAARRYDSVKAEWRGLRLWVGGEQLRSVRERRVALAAAEEQARQRLDASVAERDELSSALAGMHSAAGEAGEALERDRTAAARLETTAERLQSIALVARERRLGLERSVQGVGDRHRAIESELGAVESGLLEALDEERRASEAADRSAIALRALEDEERSLSDADRLPTEGMAASLRGDLAALETASLRDDRERADLIRRRATVAAVIEEERIEAARLAGEADVARRELDAVMRELADARSATSKDREAATAAEERWRDAESAAAAARAYLEALEAALAGFTDTEARARAAIIEGVVGTIAQRLDIPADLESAAAAALGPWAEAFVAADADGVADATGLIKSDGLGGVAFVSARGGSPAPARDVARVCGVDALVDLLGPGADRELASTLVGDVVFVQGWAAARSIVADHPQLRAVTPEGDLITAVGVVAAHPDGVGPAAVEKARVELERAVTELARARSRHATTHRAAEASAATEDQVAAGVHELERALGGSIEAMRLLERSMGERQSEMERLDARLRALAEEAVTRLDRSRELHDQIAGLEGDEAGRQHVWDDLARRRVEVARMRDEAREQREAAAAAVAAVTERRALLERRREELVLELESGAQALAAPATLAELTTIEEGARRAGEVVRSHIGALRERERVLRSEVGAAGTRLEETRSRRDELAAVIEATREELSAVAVESAELRVREESVAEALRRDTDADEDEALGAVRPELPDGVEPGAHLDSLAASLRRMGPVNPLAAAEYEELSEKVRFMQEQLADLETSRAELRKVIRALDEEIARLFVEAFEEISAIFAENFTLLFPGGTGRLTLTEPDDPLTTGVDIHAQPMGKKVGRLTLLSGGERSLAALAFLFAVFRSRPSPFYVLDEVEAALDDANLRRFIRLVAGVRGGSQLVIVTHQQQTMEAADILYGVTMEPGESSRVLAKRLVTV
jgi:chromosome segregation protein